MTAAVAAALGVGSGTASAHPLGNFTVNHYDGLTLFRDRVEDRAVVDTAEIPTLQEQPSVDRDHNGVVTSVERQSYGQRECGLVERAVRLRIDGRSLSWSVADASFTYRPGAGGLKISRLECRLVAAADLNAATTVSVTDGFRADRVGWHEITARSDGVRLERSPVPLHSVSAELRHYPNDLLSSPLDVRSAVLRVIPGPGTSTYGKVAALPVAGPIARALDGMSTRFNSLVGSHHLTPAIGFLAVLLSLVLGASHAALPGHGKTVMAAYIAGRRGSVRDAVTVGATVTATHTGGVLLLGLLLTLVASLAGETVLGYLGVASGLLIAGIGVGLLHSAWRSRRAREHRTPDPRMPMLVGAVAGSEHGHGHRGGDRHEHGHDHGHEHGLGHGHPDGPLGRGGLVGMGVAGGLVPSPTALVVLLAAVGSGRTLFGVLLVIGYGLGMAATLTAAGLLLVHLRGRLDTAVSGRFGALTSRLAGAAPVLTALLVLVVGIGLAVRGLVPLL
ncbi:MAG: High-affinity nickel-transporter [Actinomycetota bacterium]|nr:High-affinity nickel-transporter [Actinomycetota bacterium]